MILWRWIYSLNFNSNIMRFEERLFKILNDIKEALDAVPNNEEETSDSDNS